MKNISDDGRDGHISIFGGLDKIINLVGNMVDSDKDEVNRSGVIKPHGDNKLSSKYSFNIKLGADGKERIKSLDEILDKKASPAKCSEPVTDVFENVDKVTIVIELPCVEKDDIRLNIDGSAVTVSAEGCGICYFKRIALKFTPDYSSIKENFSNSIYSLEITKTAAE
jgi:HSP20 family protein